MDLAIEPAFRTSPSPAYARQLALAKRFYERWRGDRDFREALEIDPQRTLAEAGLPFTPEEVRSIYDSAEASRPSQAARQLQAFLREKLTWRSSLREQMKLPTPGLDAWRRRQVQRCAWQLGSANADAIIHPPAAFELSRGCTVGCWFCGVSAGKFQGHWPASPENLMLWRQVLEVMLELCGPAGASSFLYWATDPLDNPDYESFCLEFAKVFGHFPQTTTALALRNVERTRSLIRLAQQHGSPNDRFSVLTRKQLLGIHQAFSPEELLQVELVLQNKESLGVQSAAGKALAKLDPKTSTAHTIACISGFLFNMPEQSVRMITPCPASEQFPDGYQTLHQSTFADARQLREILLAWSQIPTRLTLDDVPRWREDLVCLPLADGFRLQDQHRGMDLRDGPLMAQLGSLVGELSVAQICLQVPQDPAVTLLCLQRFYEAAFFA